MPADRRPGPALPERMPNRCRPIPAEPGRPRACSARSCASTGSGRACPRRTSAARATVSHDVISKIETGERPPAEDFPPRLDAVPELDTCGALTRLRDHLKKGHKQRLYGWFQQWADIEARATVLRWYGAVRQRQILPWACPMDRHSAGLFRLAAAEQAFVEPQADEAGDHADNWYQHQILPLQRAQHERAERRPGRQETPEAPAGQRRSHEGRQQEDDSPPR